MSGQILKHGFHRLWNGPTRVSGFGLKHTGTVETRNHFFSSLLGTVNPNPGFFGAHHATELVAGFPFLKCSSQKNQNCDQENILKFCQEKFKCDLDERHRVRFRPNPQTRV